MCLVQKLPLSYSDVLVTCSKDKLLLVYSWNCSDLTQKNLLFLSPQVYHLFKPNQVLPFHFQGKRSVPYWLNKLHFFVSYVLCFRRPFWGLFITSALLSGLTHQPASLWDPWDGTSRKSVCFGLLPECWNLTINECLSVSEVGETKSVTAEGKGQKEKSKEKIKFKCTVIRDSASHWAAEVYQWVSNFFLMGLEQNCVAKPQNLHKKAWRYNICRVHCPSYFVRRLPGIA